MVGLEPTNAVGQSNHLGNGANPSQLLPTSNPRSLACLKKGRSDDHHRNGQGNKILTYSTRKRRSFMPYKDIQKRRACSRESKRKARARQAHPLLKFRIYVCPRIPFLRLCAGIQFDNGFFVTDDLTVQERLEGSPHFARDIFPLLIYIPTYE